MIGERVRNRVSSTSEWIVASDKSSHDPYLQFGGRQAGIREPRKHTKHINTPRREVHKALIEAIPVLRIAGCFGYISLQKKNPVILRQRGPSGCSYSFLLIQRHIPSCPMIHPPSRLSVRHVRFFATPCPDSASRQTQQGKENMPEPNPQARTKRVQRRFGNNCAPRTTQRKPKPGEKSGRPSSLQLRYSSCTKNKPHTNSRSLTP